MTTTENEDFRDSFFEECEELLESMLDGFDLMAESAQDGETMNAIFRAVHSIKGGASAFGLSALVAFAHHFESALDRVRSGQRDVDDDLLDLFRQCGDNLSDLVAIARDQGDSPGEGIAALQARLDEAIGLELGAEPEGAPSFEPVTLDLDIRTPTPPQTTRYRIEFTAEPSLFTSGNEPLILFKSLGKLGDMSVRADLEDVPALLAITPSACRIRWSLTLETGASTDEIHEVFEFVETDCQLKIEAQIDVPAGLSEEAVATAGLHPPAADDAPSLADLIGVVSDRDPQDAKVKTPATRRAPDSNPASVDRRRPEGTIRVDLEKIDKLINLVGELVIKEAMLSQSIAEFAPPTESDVSIGLESLKQLAGEIQEGVMAIRAQPVKPMFQRMARIAREASAATQKRVRFVTIGEYTEVDKTVIERLVDPLTHMIRNAIDHGLESADDRKDAGKSAEGTVTLSAAHRSGRVMIDVADDGGGINRDRVRQLAIERDLILDSDVLSPTEIDNLLFLPGFSSKDEVSELSGRGVGLDVVRSEIHNLGGRVSIHSEPGEGTTFSISLPLTLAVLEGIVIRVADQTLIVPISAIQETLQPKSASIHVIGTGGMVLQNRSGLVPIIDLGAFLGFRPVLSKLDNHVLLLIESDSYKRYALIVDEIQDQRQVVIKSLETNYQQVDGVAAATILGDGRIALIIDPDNIVKGNGTIGQGDLLTQMAV